MTWMWTRSGGIPSRCTTSSRAARSMSPMCAHVLKRLPSLPGGYVLRGRSRPTWPGNSPNQAGTRSIPGSRRRHGTGRAESQRGSCRRQAATTTGSRPGRSGGARRRAVGRCRGASRGRHPARWRLAGGAFSAYLPLWARELSPGAPSVERGVLMNTSSDRSSRPGAYGGIAGARSARVLRRWNALTRRRKSWARMRRHLTRRSAAVEAAAAPLPGDDELRSQLLLGVAEARRLLVSPGRSHTVARTQQMAKLGLLLVRCLADLGDRPAETGTRSGPGETGARHWSAGALMNPARVALEEGRPGSRRLRRQPGVPADRTGDARNAN